VAKPFHIDDPMYIWAAQQIQVDPLHFYGFDVNWHGFDQPMSVANKNPPGVSFYLALVAAVFGWSEVGLHLGMLLPAVALGLGVLRLARRLCETPLVAALAVLTMPAVLLSSTTLMADVTMLALWCWAVVLWMEGLADGRAARLLAAGGLAGLAFLTKYMAVSLIPLLLAYSLAEKHRPRRWAPALLVPLAAVAAYQWWMLATYGHSPLTDVGAYSVSARDATGSDLHGRGLIGLAFLGGCLLTGLFYAPLLWSRRVLLVAAAAIPVGIAAVSALEAVGSHSLRGESGVRWGLVVQIVLFARIAAAGPVGRRAPRLRRIRQLVDERARRASRRARRRDSRAAANRVASREGRVCLPAAAALAPGSGPGRRAGSDLGRRPPGELGPDGGGRAHAPIRRPRRAALVPGGLGLPVLHGGPGREAHQLQRERAVAGRRPDRRDQQRDADGAPADGTRAPGDGHLPRGGVDRDHGHAHRRGLLQ
jgi:hypothetical protein